MINVDARLGQNVRDFTFYRHRSNELSFSGDSVGKVADGLCLLTEDEEGKVRHTFFIINLLLFLFE